MILAIYALKEIIIRFCLFYLFFIFLYIMILTVGSETPLSYAPRRAGFCISIRNVRDYKESKVKLKGKRNEYVQL